jgi:hypothetical protein
MFVGEILTLYTNHFNINNIVWHSSPWLTPKNSDCFVPLYFNRQELKIFEIICIFWKKKQQKKIKNKD